MRSGSYNISYPLYSNSKPNYKSGLKSQLSGNNIIGSTGGFIGGGTNYNSGNNSDRESIASSYRSNSKRNRPRRTSNTSIKITKTMSKKKQGMDYTNYNYNTAVSRLKLLLAESYTPTTKTTFSSFSKNGIEESGEETDNQSDRPAFNDISKYLQPNYGIKDTKGLLKKFKPYSSPLTSDNLGMPSYSGNTDYLNSNPLVSAPIHSDGVGAPKEILNFIEKQEDYIEQLEKESKFCRSELSHLLGKVKDVIHENEALTEHARSDLAKLNRESHHKNPLVSNSSESEDIYTKPISKRPKSPRHLSGPNIVFESKISELEAELAQTTIDLKKLKSENDDLKRKIASGVGNSSSSSLINCELHRKQIENLQKDKAQLEDDVRRLQKTIEEIKSEQQYANSKRHISDMAVIERSQQEIEIKHLRDELDRQHERVRELQHEMARRVSEERSNAERRYNLQVDQLGGDLNNQWEQVAKLQMELERQKRLESDLKRDVSQKNSQIEDLKQEIKSKRSNFLSDIAQVNAEKQSLEQEITSLRLQLDRADRQAKIEAARLNAEINSLRQRLDRADADVLHAKRENLRLSDEIANLEKEVTLGEMKNEIRPTRKDLDKSINELQEKHAGTVSDLEGRIQNQRQLMDKLTTECKTLTNKLEDTSLKHKMEIAALQSNVEYLTNRMINRDLLENNSSANSVSPYVSSLPQSTAPTEYETPISTANTRATTLPTTIPDGSINTMSEELTPNPKQFEYKQPSYNLSDTMPATKLSTPTSGYESTSARSITEPDNSVEPTSFTPSTPYTYEADDENKKDIYSSGEKYTRNDSNGSTPAPIRISPPRSTTKPIADPTPITSSTYDTNQPQQQIADSSKLYSTPTDSSEIKRTEPEDIQSYDQQPAADYSQYQTQGYDQYDPQQYDTTGYEGYDQQQYEGAERYEGQGYDEQQYQGYDQQYDPSAYQQSTELSNQYDQQSAPSLVQQQQQQIQQQPQPQIQQQQPQSKPLSQLQQSPAGAPTTALQPQATTKSPSGKSSENSSRTESRTGPGTLGYSNESGGGGGGSNAGSGASGDKGTKNLPTKQSTQGFKGMSGSGPKN